MSGAPVPPPNRVPWPPLIYLAAALAALALGAALPGTRWAVGAAGTGLGAILIAGGLGLDAWAMLTMMRARANILPHRSATALVTHGPFAFSRNPIYLGNTVVMAGLGFALGNPWFLPAAAVAAGAVTHLAIRREEAHLAALFGERWDAYSRRTARWLGLPREP